MKKVFFTQEGYDAIVKEKIKLDKKRESAVSELSTARDMGDRSENAFYKTARQKLSSIDRRLREIDRMLKFSEVIVPRSDGVIGIGNKVTLEDSNGQKMYTLVGKFESDLEKGWISIVSPLGRVLTGKKMGDTAVLILPQGTKHFKILKIS